MASFKQKRVYENLSYKETGDDEAIKELIFAMHPDGARYRTIKSKSTVRKMRAKVSFPFGSLRPPPSSLPVRARALHMMAGANNPQKEEEVGIIDHYDTIVLGRRAYTADESEDLDAKRRKIVDPSWVSEPAELNMGEALQQDMDE